MLQGSVAASALAMQDYAERYSGKRTAMQILGPTAKNTAKARVNLDKLMEDILPFVIMHSEAARRDCRKLCA